MGQHPLEQVERVLVRLRYRGRGRRRAQGRAGEQAGTPEAGGAESGCSDPTKEGASAELRQGHCGHVT
ncbi:hypothetical protein ACIHCX_34640 [Streptomyces sp. NPDC052043]|uniref:hypothetical protein n=1 Tax=Streptomyces sp. NPDC052043 TaxID=3365684 RepID=UPI0037D5FE34